MAMTTGVRAPVAQWSISCMSTRPCAEVAVKVRAPVRAAEMHAAIAVCSDSTLMYWDFISPVDTNSAIFSTMLVWGVMG